MGEEPLRASPMSSPPSAAEDAIGTVLGDPAVAGVVGCHIPDFLNYHLEWLVHGHVDILDAVVRATARLRQHLQKGQVRV